MDKDFRKYALSRGVNGLFFDEYAKSFSNTYIDPSIIEESTKNMTQLNVFSRLFMDRILFIGTEINSDVANIINSQLLYLNMSNPEKQINVYINSPGGSVADGLSIYDVFNFITPDVSTTCIGTAASMGAVLLSSGTKGKRNSLLNSKVMIHQPLTSMGFSQASDIAIANQELQKTKDTLYKILAENTGKSYEEIEHDCDRNKWFSSHEAVEYGLIDKVYSKEKK
jgi:ATP-dependent Clp protease protease subunit